MKLFRAAFIAIAVSAGWGDWADDPATTNSTAAAPASTASSARPNIVVILADDLGYGDVGFNGATKVKTPNMDALARGGLNFTDGHCTSSTCTPSRYSILTGEYSFRNRKAVILPGNAPLVIDPAGATLPKMLKEAGYATGFVGKWHLGLGNGNLDWNGGNLSPGPDEIGFDYSYFLPATPDRVPCVYVENHQVVGLSADDPLSVDYQKKIGNEPTGLDHPESLRYPANKQHSGTIVDHISRIGFMQGGHSAWWTDEQMAAVLLTKAEAFVAQHQKEPFFLYYCPQNIHVPRAPDPRFLHTSQCGIRGDDIEELDSVVGGMLDTLKRLGLDQNTLVIFSSDNGPIFLDGYRDGSAQEANRHTPAGPYKGGKYQIFEGGTRVPFVVSWPGRIAPGTSPALVNQLDLYSSLADLVGAHDAGARRPDSMDLLPALLGTSPTGRTNMVEQDKGPLLALREGNWKLVLAGKKRPGGPPPKLEDGDSTAGPPAADHVQLYDLGSDPHEDHDVAADHAAIVQKMQGELAQIRGGDVPPELTPSPQ